MRCAVLLLAFGAAAGARAAGSVELDTVFDSESGRSFRLSADFNPADDWLLFLDYATSTTDGPTRTFEADEYRLGASRDLGGWTVGADYARWTDSFDTESSAATLRVERRFDVWRFALGPSVGRLATQVPDPSSFTLTEERFDSRSLSVEVERAADGWRVYARAAAYDYSPSFDEFNSSSVSAELTRLRQLRLVRFLILTGRSADLEQLLTQQQLDQLRLLLQTQGLAGFDRLIAYQERRIQYVGSMQAVALGLADQSALIGVERRVGRGAVIVEYDRATLPVDGLDADTLTFAVRWPSSRDSDFTLRAGLSDAEGYDRSSFIGLALRLYFD